MTTGANSTGFAACINSQVDVSSIQILLLRKYATRCIDCCKHTGRTFFFFFFFFLVLLFFFLFLNFILFFFCYYFNVISAFDYCKLAKFN
ncbi:hypothetical protein PUN28_000421 [Cardiocondyla obscurior]|uniref:Uncharacterized protein n=1 Tax=Cardiocondyla obscurior TaxID=286306 RepID=A0AAW2GZP4_9HYME